MEENENNQVVENKPETPNNDYVPGKNEATASMVLGIIAVVCMFLSWFSIVAVGCSIAGLVLASKSKKLGYMGGNRTAGFVLSLIALILGSIVFACVLCTCITAVALGASGALSELEDLYGLY